MSKHLKHADASKLLLRMLEERNMHYSVAAHACLLVPTVTCPLHSAICAFANGQGSLLQMARDHYYSS